MGSNDVTLPVVRLCPLRLGSAKIIYSVSDKRERRRIGSENKGGPPSETEKGVLGWQHHHKNQTSEGVVELLTMGF